MLIATDASVISTYPLHFKILEHLLIDSKGRRVFIHFIHKSLQLIYLISTMVYIYFYFLTSLETSLEISEHFSFHFPNYLIKFTKVIHLI